MSRKQFESSELLPTATHTMGASAVFGENANLPNVEPIYGNRPITEKENFKLLFQGKKPYWMPRAGWAFCDVKPHMTKVTCFQQASYDASSL